MTSPFLGQIIQGGWNFAPRGYSMASGQIMSIAQNTALFSLLGTTYGGNGQTTFALPNLNGRSMIGTGQLAGGSFYSLGEVQGTETTTLLITNMPQHNHTATFSGSGAMNASTTKATVQVPSAGATLGKSVDGSSVGSQPDIYCPSGTATPVALGGLNVAGTVTVNVAGGSQPFSILNPQLVVTVCIAIEGIFPSRN